ncbi:hypothetical protein [Candidatus Uabimicrobium sp. HlEnr_7]|uniref:hypothetical protein n=1 Tax=Candidatus Uabimicrobium helgolandensis TaxID=3095367 RepID=UPI003556BA4E
MSYTNDFMNYIARDVSETNFKKHGQPEEMAKKYGVFLRKILEAIFRDNQIPIIIDKEDVLMAFLGMKLPVIMKNFSKEKGSFRKYLKKCFRNYIIDEIRKTQSKKNVENRTVPINDNDYSLKNEVYEQIIDKEFDLEYSKNLFKILDSELESENAVQCLLGEYLKNFKNTDNDYRINERYYREKTINVLQIIIFRVLKKQCSDLEPEYFFELYIKYKNLGNKL